jgi:hypothetical protein
MFCDPSGPPVLDAGALDATAVDALADAPAD